MGQQRHREGGREETREWFTVSMFASAARARAADAPADEGERKRATERAPPLHTARAPPLHIAMQL
jgi:hypothetical protein